MWASGLEMSDGEGVLAHLLCMYVPNSRQDRLFKEFGTYVRNI